jgi:HlyD family secretion protein
LKAAQSRLEQMVFYAPNDGYVLDVSIDRIGEMMQAGQTLVEIAPEDDPLVLSAVIPSQEAGLVEDGMDVQVKMDAFPYQEYGILSGTVSTIAPDTEMDEKIGPVYRLEIALDKDYVMHENQKMELKPGQTAQAEIVIRKRRIIDLLLDPIRKLKNSNINL